MSWSFWFDDDKDHARFYDLVTAGRDLAGRYHAQLQRVLVTAALAAGENAYQMEVDECEEK